MRRLLRISLDTKTCRFDDMPVNYMGLGGRGLTSIYKRSEGDIRLSPEIFCSHR